MAAFRSDDRVLFLSIPSRADLAAVARVLMSGVLVALGTRDEVEEARQSMADFENVMFIDASPERIPWREAYFSKIVVPPHLESLLPQITTELHRILAPGGQIIRSALAV